MNNESFYKEFPNLVALDLQLKTDVERLKKEMHEVKNHSRYADNESERQYQLGQLEKEYEETLAKAEADFQVELEATELHLAEQAFSLPEVAEEERQKAEQLANTVKAQLLTSSNKANVLELLKTRIKTMNDAEKQAVKLTLVSMEIDGTDEVLKALDDTSHMRAINEQLQALHRIKTGGGSLRRKYDATNKAVKEVFDRHSTSSGGIDKEFYEKHLKRSTK